MTDGFEPLDFAGQCFNFTLTRYGSSCRDQDFDAEHRQQLVNFLKENFHILTIRLG